MAEVVLKIKTNEGADVLLGFTADKIVNNVSTLIGGITTDNNGVNGKSFATGFLSLSDGYLGGQDTKLQSEVKKYNGFMFGATNETGDYTMTLALQGTNLDKIIITGDKEANQFPIKAILDEGTEYEKTVYSDDLSWAIAFEQESNSHTIKFTKWNRPNYNTCFTTLKVMLEYLELNKGWIDNVNSLTQSTSDVGSIQFGVLSNSGNTNIRDLNKKLKEYIRDGILDNSNVPVEVYVNNNKVQTHITSDSEYIEQDGKLSLQLTNDINKMENTKVNFPNYLIKTEQTLYEILFHCFANLGYKQGTDYDLLNTLFYEKVGGGLVEITTVDYLSRFKIKYPYFMNRNLLTVINYICEIAQLNCIKDANNRLFFVTSNPIRNEIDTKLIHIPIYAQINNPQRNLFVKNKINNVSYIKRNILKNYSILFEKEYNIFDKDALEYTTKELGENSSIYSSGNIEYICFFVKVSTNEKNINIYDITYDNDGIYPYTYYITNEKDTTKGGSIVNYSQSDKEVSQINWENLSVGVHRMLKYETPTNAIFAVKLKYDNIEYSPAVKIKLILRGISYKIIEENISNSNKDVLELPSNSLFSTEDTYTYRDNTTVDIYTYAKNNILKYCKNGFQYIKLRVFATDYYAYGGITGKIKYKILDFKNKGEVFKLNDNIVIDKDNNGTPMFTYPDGTHMIWRITGIDFIYDGQPCFDLELQEVKEYGN